MKRLFGTGVCGFDFSTVARANYDFRNSSQLRMRALRPGMGEASPNFIAANAIHRHIHPQVISAS